MMPSALQITGDLESCVCEEEHRETPVVLVRLQAQVVRKTFELCVTDVAT